MVVAKPYIALVALATLILPTLDSAQLANAQVSSGSSRPFVIGVIPVIGRRGAVGGITVDPEGAVSAMQLDDRRQLHAVRLAALKTPKVVAPAPAAKLRKVSLSRLQDTIVKLRQKNQPLPAEILLLAGLQDVQYVFCDPSSKDIILAGKAEPWQLSEDGEIVGKNSKRPTLQLEDLIAALRIVQELAEGEPISCSIDPSDEGLTRVQAALPATNGRVGLAQLKRFEQALGPQNITFNGVPTESVLAHVLLASDYQMKRLAMGHDRLNGLANYLSLLQRATSSGQSVPRWWIDCEYRNGLQDPKGMAFQVPQARLKVHSDGRSGRGPAAAWAKRFEKALPVAMKKYTVFARLQSLCQLLGVASIIQNADLELEADCDLFLFYDAKTMKTHKLPAPKTVPSMARATQSGRPQVVAVSGGVKLTVGSQLTKVTPDQRLILSRTRELKKRKSHWWWD